jgi:hypothetical protein
MSTRYALPRASWRTLLFSACAPLLFAPASTAQDAARRSGPVLQPSPQTAALVRAGGGLQDGSFEAGSPNPFWNEASDQFGSPICSPALCGAGAVAEDGTFLVWMGGTGDGPPAETASVSQEVSVEAGTYVMTYYVNATFVDDASDFDFSVQVGDDTIFELDEDLQGGTFPTGEYVELTETFTFDEAATFTVLVDYAQTGNASIFIDNISLAAPPPPDQISFSPDPVTASAMTGMTASSSVTLMNMGDDAVDFSVVGFDEDGGRSALAWETIARAPAEPARRGAASPDRKGGATFSGDAVRFGAGGPDAFGYTWIDSNEPGGPAYDFIDISGTGTAATLTAVGATFPAGDEGYVDIPFSFSYYGETYESVRAYSNGLMTVNGFIGNTFSNQNIPIATAPNGVIAPFWDDFDLTDSGTIYTETLADGRLVVQWQDAALFAFGGGGDQQTFQVILSPSGEILFQYATVNGAASGATVGTENQDGTAGLNVAFNQPYIESGLAVSISNVPQFVADVTPSSGTIPAGGSVTLNIDFEAQDVGGLYQAVLTVETSANDVQIPLEYTVTGTPVLGTDVDDLDLGTITQGFPSTATFFIQNTGDDVLTVTGIESSDDAFSTDFGDEDVVIAAGDSVEVTVTFDPDGTGDFSGMLTISSDGGTVMVNLTGTANSAGEIDVTPDVVTATAESGETATATLTISNSGVGALDFSFLGFEDEDGDRQAQMKARYDAQFGRGIAAAPEQKDAVDARTGGLADYLRAGGPDAFGYVFADSDEPGGPAYMFEDISGSGTPLSLGDDAVATVDLPFGFSFYGESYSQAVVSSNGFISFNADAGSDLSNDPIPTAGGTDNLIAVFWDDLNPAVAASDDVYVQDMGDGRFIVQWNQIVRFGQTAPLTFQAILSAGGGILLQYETVDLTGVTATVGIENADGTDGLEASFNEDDYLRDGLAIRFVAVASFISDVDPAEGSIPSDGSQEVTVTFDADGLFAGVYEGNLVIQSNDSDESTLLVPVEFTVTGQPEISIEVDGIADGDSLGFGTAIPGDEVVRSVTVFNDGTDALSIDAAITKGIGQNNAFSFVSGALDPIAPGDSAAIVIAFEPDEQGEFSASLVIESDDADEGEIEIGLFGTGLEPPAASVDPEEIELDYDLVTDVDQITASFTLSNASSTPLDYAVRANLELEEDVRPADGPTRTTTSTGTARDLFAPASEATAAPNVDAARADPGDVIDQVTLANDAPLGITMSSDGLIYVADLFAGLTEVFDVDLTSQGTIPNPVIAGGVTTGVAYNPGTETLWFMNVVQQQDGTVTQSALYEATLNGAATGTVVQVPNNGGAVVPTGVEFDPATNAFFYVDIAGDDIYALGLDGVVLDGYPVPQTGEDDGNGLLGNGLDVLGGTLEVLTGTPNVDPGADRIVRTDLLGNTITTAISGLVTSTGDEFINDIVRSRVAPNEVIYVVGNATGTLFAVEADERDDLGNVAVSPDMGTVGGGEDVEITLTIDTADLEVGTYSGEVVIVTNDPSNPTITIPIELEVVNSVANETDAPVTEFTLRPTYPNPVSVTGTVRYGLPTASAVEVRLYDVTGRLVSTLVNAEKAAGWHDAPVNAGQLAPGVYVVAIRAGTFSATQKLTIVR